MERGDNRKREADSAHEAERDVICAITDERLSAVAFGADFTQFQFDRATLNVKNPPEIVFEGVARYSGEPTYRDALCAMIAHHVRACSVRADHVMEIEFDDGTILRIALGAICVRNQGIRFERGDITWSF